MSSSPALARSTALLVLGMHRSGTSALTGALQGLGLPLGSELVAAGPDNPGGYFEHAGAVTLNDTLLAALGRGWEDLRSLPADWLLSPAAQEAALAIQALVQRDFRLAKLWALKDPRLCRLLPLWRQVLQNLGIGCKCLLVLRHPDEVAASLQSRDDIEASYAYLLWLHYVRDAERESRKGERSVLTYDRLLSDPAASLAAAGKDLRIAWPVSPTTKALTKLMDSTQRHHRAGPDGAATGPRRWALALYAQLAANGRIDAETSLALDQRLDRWQLQLTPLLAGMGSALARERRAHGDTRRHCEQADVALAEATHLSLQHLDELRATHARLATTDVALQASEAMSLQRLDQLGVLSAQLARTESGFLQATRLAMTRLDDVQGIQQRLEQTEAALDAATLLAMTRLDDVQGVQLRLEQTEAALDAATRLAHVRLQDLATLDARLTMTSRALQDAEATSLQRLNDLASLDRKMQVTDVALQDAERLAHTRAQELAALDARLADMDWALASVTAQSRARLQELEVLSRQLADTDAALNGASDLALHRQAELVVQQTRLRHAESTQAEAERLAMERLQAWELEVARVNELQEAMATASVANAAESEQLQQDIALAKVARATEFEQLHRRLQATDATLSAVTRTRSWRYTRSLRTIAGWFGCGAGRVLP